METNFHKGRLKSWNEDKGFGFIEPENGKKDVFVHVSALKRMSRRPVVGDVINYQIHIDKDGKNRAVDAKIEGVSEVQLKIGRKNIKNHNSNKWSSKFFAFVLLMLITFTVYNKFFGTTSLSIIPVLQEQENKINYSCNGKVYCSEMTSCEEAKFYQNNCPSTKMDGDGDGVPCESQWCTW